jgi:hypothetical protein
MASQRNQKDGSQSGRSAGGKGKNQTSECRYPEKKKKRKKSK